ncbi:MAG: type IV secretory system conjugative DNA transfer family protein [Sphingomonadaceae bacterium]|nr:type IV secretory system conjugative DNA transfer family protein [Novosphingobium sp.]MCP5391902.1 type IV secretory system conjugative DNA transfer family protein [Sphingomonadaceae bacterium]
MINHEEFRFGSAGWEVEEGIGRAGLIEEQGTPIGFWQQRMIRLEGDASSIIFGGAGTGKLRDILAYDLCLNGHENRVVLDPRGELASISMWNLIRFGSHGWCFNPFGIPGLPQHCINPLEILTPRSPTLHADATLIAKALIVSKGTGESDTYFIPRAHQYLTEILKSATLRFGAPHFGLVYEIIASIESDHSAWADHIEFMLSAGDVSMRRAAGEMLTKQQDTPKEFGGIMGTIYGGLSCLDDPNVRAALSRSDFSFADFASGKTRGTLYLNPPAEFLPQLAPILRVIFEVAMILKNRAPDAPRMNFIIDEAGQMGRFDTIKRVATYGRGMGVRGRFFFQDPGQVMLNFGREGLQSFMNSCQLRAFLPPRDLNTAQLISAMLGNETLSYDDVLAQNEMRHRSKTAAMDFLFGGDPFRAALDHRHFKQASKNRVKQARSLMTPDELLALPDDRCILFISGKNLKPILANKYPYYSRPEMAGMYLNNPYHPPEDRVLITTRRGERWARIVTERIPPALAHYPQYQDGYVRYVEGYRPF